MKETVIKLQPQKPQQIINCIKPSYKWNIIL